MLEIAKRTDLFLYDLKLMDSERHREWTGAGNKRILQNLTALAETGAAVQIRIPLIKGVNADDDNINATAAFVAALPGPARQISLLPYHDVAEGKFAKLGRDYQASPMTAPDAEDLARVIACFSSHGLTASVGG